MEKEINKFVSRKLEIKNLQKEVHKGFQEVRGDVKSLEKSTKDIFREVQVDIREVKTDIEGMKRLMVERFTETDEKIDKIVEAMRGFLKLHEVLDEKVFELEKRLGSLEHQVQLLQAR